MVKLKLTMYAIVVFTFILTVFSGCEKALNYKLKMEKNLVPIDNISFKDIPGITQSEINAIEALQKKYTRFVYGVYPSTEAFIGKNGEINGYSVMFCDWLSRIFGIQFNLVYYQWGDLLRGLESGEIDFTGELMVASENQANFFMSPPTIHRTIKSFRLKDSPAIAEIRRTRRPNFAFLRGAVAAADIGANTNYTYETILVDSHEDAYLTLKNGKADAFFSMDTAEGAFYTYGDIISEDFFPLVFRSSCLSTKNEELRPIISAMGKAINNRVLEYLSEMQKTGYREYRENRMYAMLTEEEHLFIQDNPVIIISGDPTNYPISFYSRNNKWEGIYFEVLDEVSRLTGLKFEIGNDKNTQLLETIEMVEHGEEMILPELFHIKEYEDHFIWSDIPIVTDHFAFISRANFRNIDINDLFHLNVGINKHSLYSDIFKGMFPDHQDFIEFETMEETWEALRRGEVDVIFSSQRRLVIYTNYYEMADFKLNLVFEHTFDSFFAYNKNAVLLKSIIDKALHVISINNIANQWIYKTYDYRNKMAAAQRPWLIGASILFFLVLLLVTNLLLKSRHMGKHLEDIVAQRTSALSFETSKLNAIFDSIPDYIFCKDTDLRYIQCNDSFEQFMGVNEENFLGKSNKEGAWFSPEEEKMIQYTDLAVLNENRRHIIEENVRSPSTGETVAFEMVKAPIRQNDSVVGIVAIARDITRRKEMEEELKSASHAKSSFLAHMSHELRTPLNVIIGLTDLILEDDDRLEKPIANNLVKISNAGSTLLSIVNDILDFSKIESGKLTLTPIAYHIPSLLSDIITLTVTRIGEKPIKFKLNISDDLPRKLYGDDLRVKQVFTNLLTNAVKYTREGSIELSIHCTREDDTVWMDASVADTGMGIPKKDIDNLFLDYYQVAANATRNIEGTGLGLSITKKLVKMMDGEISVESERGKGSKFSFRIKQGFFDDRVIGENAEKLRNFTYSDDRHIAARKLERLDLSYARVLVVDDMQTNLDVAMGLLGKYKMEIDCFTNGQAAIDRIRKGTPVYRAIFMDHMMPGMDGIETVNNIRALDTEYARKIPIIALTANAIQGTEKMFYDHGFQAFITKPINVKELDIIVREWVRDKTKEEVLISGDSSSEDENIAIDIPGVDTEKGLSLYVGETKVYLPLLHSYVANTPKVLTKMRTVSAENLPDYVVTVHGLKGTSAGIGAEEIREAAFELEKLSRAGDLQGVLAKNSKLIADTEIIVANVKEWLDKNDIQKAKPRKKAPDSELLAQLQQNCESYDIDSVEEVMSKLESFDYDEDTELISWIREKIDISKMGEIAKRLAAG
jgi:PAS domain S-box-containing protein